ncbi:hypothetical protein GCM10010994_60960 [Chelatococcus reniformis]|uniref:Uncharacterized protein n=1 Tax=Chelatococcus reniformis TaxID=1494448 RepID=A0A916UYP5_9HYPH|nr:hypothetical protein GCM10010994_60960 [Chelatococcus reniformis]
MAVAVKTVAAKPPDCTRVIMAMTVHSRRLPSDRCPADAPGASGGVLAKVSGVDRVL